MRNAIGAIGTGCLTVCLLFAPALAQNRMAAGASPAVTGPDLDLGVGYTYLRMPIPGAGQVDLKGIDVNGRINFFPHWGGMLDANYARTPNVLGTNHAGYLLGLQGGPVFYPVERGNTRVFLHLLAGMGLVDGAVPISDTRIFHGWQSQFSYAAGGGVERPISGPFGVRFTADYLRTSFFNAAGEVEPQNNLRLTASLVFRLSRRPVRSSYR